MKKLFILFALIVLPINNANSISLDFVKRGFKHCTGYCETGKINCQKGKDKQGYYDWCKKNCLHDGKTNLQVFVDGIASCDAKEKPKAADAEEKAKAAPAIPTFTKNFLGKVVEGDKDHGFKIQIVAQKESGKTAQSGEFAFLHPDKTPADLKIGDYIQVNTITAKELPAYNYGRLKTIQDMAEIVK